jgi:predicted enzyme related to lactoylglutathione lyase
MDGATPSVGAEIAVTIDAENGDRAAAFWTAALGYRIARDRHPYVVLLPADGRDGPEVLIQRVDAVTPGKARVHLDLVVDDREAEVRRMMSLGAHAEGEVDETANGGSRWTVLTDPEGTHFCVVQRRPAAVGEDGNAG